MKVFVSHQSAIEYWRSRNGMSCSNAKQRCRVTLSESSTAVGHAGLPGRLMLKLPLHIMLGKPGSRWEAKSMKQHVFTGETPDGCFISVDEKLFISSPEFCFLQMANQITLLRLIELGYELCGTYSIPVAGDQNVPEKGFYNRRPLTSTKKLAAFLARMPGVKGHRKAIRALQYILDDSASPMETKLAIILTLPYKLGGFGLAKPELNKRVVPSKAGKRLSGKTSYVCDLFWSDKGLSVEYDSTFFHSGQKQIAEDSKKRDTMTMMGFTVITVTKQQLYDEKEFKNSATVIAKCLGKRLTFRNTKFHAAHLELREQLL